MTVPDALSPAGLSAVAFLLAQVADVVTTTRALRRPGTREANPIFARLMLSPLGGFIKLAIAGGVLTLLLSDGALWPVWLATVVTGGVAWQNTMVGR